MEQQVTQSAKLLNNVLKVMVIALVGVLISVVVTMILWAVGLF